MNKDVEASVLADLYTPPRGLSKDDITEAIQRYRNPAYSQKRPSEEELRSEEYLALMAGLPHDGDGSKYFICERQSLDSGLVPSPIAQLSRVSRLREVRALTGFSRVKPANASSDVPIAPLSMEEPRWYPALEVLGEGIFIRLDSEELNAWARTRFAVERSLRLKASQDRLSAVSMSATLPTDARSVVLHSLAHALIDELALYAGYPAASLRERVYDADDQCGVLIYTATADSAGSLGGLAALSHPERFGSILRSAMKRATWCTTDPVCIESGPNGVDGLNLAACHACLLLPETSCERLNLALDRACLIGTHENVSGGLFSHLRQ